ncbi:MAG: hypothetical protein A3I07_01915 [Candidatus Doudnabacteria bacterium RIFCSPLOWO2_02_FULL_42_9]|uniref:Uncharacterized protein n=1 Tax=Candidatus Doudnabacteria bacterium RIFCSPHIGHO2_01_FULL_41_86 TaxID=1817821 RepID=A0A1F5N9V7_9BACT|nr:MAG: hypothetical protein A2717_02850 [Candidatus Doudnabacteria bacterium RIFCSPHIGHO2_01_FULL_41_86]OGE74706.1 MAG: hypothetical protein A3K07_00540 [Candidatus Doudnabacteria bacterium RIFCSPHIGHO2_01_43_10]OGE85486.1 MAG: hypothetical protein A3E28_02420 [Candidatus Doudnabacteria bacterium RIFCSPHIGHO2_12_FULL_42_22]OGE87024.1 MAG: hypothetical protein A3C49_03255 [Candidatus Doudnabacteria bacterium RIFCSPHIGHO2_02_FULL_42_25]OGE92623.1 MAG: hypothetical protein A2895_03410 [Candidatus
MEERDRQRALAEIASAIRQELDSIQSGEEFPGTKAFEYMQILLDLIADETVAPQIPNIKKSLDERLKELQDDYSKASPEERSKIVENIKKDLESFLKRFESR